MRHDGVYEPYVKSFEVVKINKLIHLRCIETGDIHYTVPEHLRPYIRNREQLRYLGDRLMVEWQSPKDAIRDFEALIRP